MSGGLAGFNPRDVDHAGYSEEELHGRTCSCGTRYLGPGGCPDCATRVRLDFRTGKVETFDVGRRVKEDPAAVLLRACADLDMLSAGLQALATRPGPDPVPAQAVLLQIRDRASRALREYEAAR